MNKNKLGYQCDCLSKVKKELDEHNLRIEGMDVGFAFGNNVMFTTLILNTRKGARGYGNPLVLKYCPFCGKRADNGIKTKRETK